MDANGVLSSVYDSDNRALRVSPDGLSAAYSRLYGPRAVVLSDSLGLGDSSQHGITAGTEQNLHGLRSWFTWLCLYSGGALRLADNLAVNGYNSTQLRTSVMGSNEPLSAVTVAAESDASIVFLMVNTNDAGESMPLATTIANFDSMLSTLRAAGKLVVLVGLLPRPTGLTAGNLRRVWAAEWAATNNVPYVDPYDEVVDRSSGEFVTAYTRDGTHHSYQGAKVIGRAVWEAIAGWIQPAPTPLASYQNADKTHPTNMLTNAMFLSDGTAGRPADWTAGAANGITHELVDDDRWVGKVWHTYGNPTTATATLSMSIATGWSVGDVIAFGFRFRFDIDEWTADDATALARVEFIDGAAPNRHELAGLGGTERTAAGAVTAGLDYVDVEQPVDFWIVTDPITAGTTALKAMVSLPAGIFDWYWGQPTMVNLTTAGVL